MTQDARLQGTRLLGYLVVKSALPAPERPFHGGSRAASIAEQVVYSLLCLAAELLSPVKQEDFGDLIADGKDGVQGSPRLLKDHGYLVAANGPHLILFQFQQLEPTLVVSAKQDDAPRFYLAGIGYKAQDSQGGHCLSRTGFPHYSQRFSLPYVQVQVIEGIDNTLISVKPDREVSYLDEVFQLTYRLASLGSKISLKASPSRLKPSTKKKMNRPGIVTAYQYFKGSSVGPTLQLWANWVICPQSA